MLVYACHYNEPDTVAREATDLQNWDARFELDWCAQRRLFGSLLLELAAFEGTTDADLIGVDIETVMTSQMQARRECSC